MQSWRVLDGHLCHLLLMISLNCPLAICRKKGEYIWMEIGGDFYFIYLLFYFNLFYFVFCFGALDCI